MENLLDKDNIKKSLREDITKAFLKALKKTDLYTNFMTNKTLKRSFKNKLDTAMHELFTNGQVHYIMNLVLNILYLSYPSTTLKSELVHQIHTSSYIMQLFDLIQLFDLYLMTSEDTIKKINEIQSSFTIHYTLRLEHFLAMDFYPTMKLSNLVKEEIKKLNLIQKIQHLQENTTLETKTRR